MKFMLTCRHTIEMYWNIWAQLLLRFILHHHHHLYLWWTNHQQKHHLRLFLIGIGLQEVHQGGCLWSVERRRDQVQGVTELELSLVGTPIFFKYFLRLFFFTISNHSLHGRRGQVSVARFDRTRTQKLLFGIVDNIFFVVYIYSE